MTRWVVENVNENVTWLNKPLQFNLVTLATSQQHDFYQLGHLLLFFPRLLFHWITLESIVLPIVLDLEKSNFFFLIA